VKSKFKYLPVFFIIFVLSLGLQVFTADQAHAYSTHEVDQVDKGVSDSIVRLYYGVFDRAPDQEGLEYWVDLYLDGTSLNNIADEFVISSEWESRYGDLADPEYVEVLYNNVLDRDPDLEGEIYWIAELESNLNRSELLRFFSESEEFIAKTGTTEPKSPLTQVPTDSGVDRRIIYDIDAQRVWMVNEQEVVEDSYLVSGRANTPNVGEYNVFSKSPVAWAGHDGITMKNMIRFTMGRTLAIGFHSIPRYSNGNPMQTEEQLGTYRSAGCIRQSDDKAAALYAWADIGTKVVVLE